MLPFPPGAMPETGSRIGANARGFPAPLQDGSGMRTGTNPRTRIIFSACRPYGCSIAEQRGSPAHHVFARCAVGINRLSLLAGVVETVCCAGIFDDLDRLILALRGIEHPVANCGRNLFVGGREEHRYRRSRLVVLR